MNQFVQVQYQNSREGLVDDVTLDELIGSKRISHFYRPSEQRWISVTTDPVRGRGGSNSNGFSRRASDSVGNQEKDGVERTPRRLFQSIFKGHNEHARSRKRLTPDDWFERGLQAFRITNNQKEAVRDFALAIQMDPSYERAYVWRGIAYENLGNLQQAIEDYSKAIPMDPGNGTVYYLRGLALKRTGKREEGISDLKKAAGLGYHAAIMYLKSLDMFL